jgi:prepilin-type processing-associated H-X9-DG protein
MTQDLVQSAMALADALAEENRALDGLEFARAARWLEAKAQATSAFIAAQAWEAPAAMRTRRQVLEAAVVRLRDLAAENKQLLERAVIVQRRVIGSIVDAIPKSGPAPRYGSSGAFADGHVRPMALSSRA